MFIFFFVCLAGVVAMIPIHVLSVKHLELEKKYGQAKGKRIGELLGLFSGWGFFIFWAGLWFSPQPRFSLPFLSGSSIVFPFIGVSVPIVHFLASIPLLLLGAWLGIAGVKETTLRVAETHRAKKIVTSSVYSLVRHPQYLGGFLAHVGVTFLLSAWYSLISTPLMLLLVFLVSHEEEKELAKEFGKEYSDYAAKVPMFFPRFEILRKRLQ